LAPTLGPSPGQGVMSLSPGWGTGWGQPGRRSLGCRLLLAFCLSMDPLVGINRPLGRPASCLPVAPHSHHGRPKLPFISHKHCIA